jgi:hypothetical protein
LIDTSGASVSMGGAWEDTSGASADTGGASLDSSGASADVWFFKAARFAFRSLMCAGPLPLQNRAGILAVDSSAL